MTLVLGIMLGMGILGGVINCALAPGDAVRGRNDWARAVLLGVGAAILIPLFLNTISSNLLSDVLKTPEPGASALVFAGFCLVAAISSRAFIQTLADRVLAEAREAKRTANEAKAEVDKVAETVTEVAEAVTEPEMAPASASAPGNAASPGDLESLPSASAQVQVLSDEERAFLRTMDDSKFTLRSMWGIGQQTGRSPEDVELMLRALAEKGVVSRIQGRKGERWTLTAAGREALRD
jgi:predicted transcriptional regulator